MKDEGGRMKRLNSKLLFILHPSAFLLPITAQFQNSTVRWSGSNTGDGIIVGSNSKWGFSAGSSTNSGGAWALTAGSCGWRVDLADGTFLGLPISNIALGGATVGIYGTREQGLKFVTH